MNINKIALGTAQFGLNYGISNQSGQVSPEEISKILTAASVSGVLTLDTAVAYGNSEERLGANDLQEFRVVSKLPEIPVNMQITDWVASNLTDSLKRLRITRLHGLLLHRPLQLLESRGEQVYAALLAQKQQGCVSKIGVSVYSPDELERLLGHFDFDLIQIPFNIFDQRLVTSGLLGKLKKKGCEVHVRSVFLQGLLLLSSEKRPDKFLPWHEQWQQYDAWLKSYDLSALEACLRSISGISGIDRLVLGLESQQQFEQIRHIMSLPPLSLPAHLGVEDEQLLNPAKWSQL